MTIKFDKMIPNKQLTQTVFILFLSIISAFIYNLFSVNPLPLLHKPIKLEARSYLSVEQSKELFVKHEAVFIDARKSDEYEAGHIKDAVNIPAQLSRSEKLEKLSNISKDRNIIVYCGNPLCNSAERLAGEMKFMGYKHVAIFIDGWESWPLK